MKIYHNKLIRDDIPKLIEANGKTPIVRTLTDDEFKTYLEKKLDEEVEEFHESKSAEELADILEVVYALAEVGGCGALKLDRRRTNKRVALGGFSRRTLLIAVDSEEAMGDV